MVVVLRCTEVSSILDEKSCDIIVRFAVIKQMRHCYSGAIMYFARVLHREDTVRVVYSSEPFIN